MSTALLAAGVLGLTSGIGAGFYGTLISSAVLQLAPTGQIGRVMGALSFSSMAAVPITVRPHRTADRRIERTGPFPDRRSAHPAGCGAAFATPEVRRLAIDRTDSARNKVG